MGSSILAVPANPQRVSLLFWPQPGSTYVFGPAPLAGANTGWQISNTTPFSVITYSDVGALICGIWYALNGTLGLSAAYTEVEFF